MISEYDRSRRRHAMTPAGRTSHHTHRKTLFKKKTKKKNSRCYIYIRIHRNCNSFHQLSVKPSSDRISGRSVTTTDLVAAAQVYHDTYGTKTPSSYTYTEKTKIKGDLYPCKFQQFSSIKLNLSESITGRSASTTQLVAKYFTMMPAGRTYDNTIYIHEVKKQPVLSITSANSLYCNIHYKLP